ncbi:MAG: hypothetical protein SPK00_06560 [Corynebacterium glucuronolyticum]|nr:hypothetical protein [Corynebacterium glucuronolyticum]MDD7586201.1 hypothetical protein [Mycobacteriaceae bacterium]MDY5834393.1 hypothetical protein [Corynebacterium glucuronolyticum]
MKKSIVATLTTAALLGGSLAIIPIYTSAQEMTYAETYQPKPYGASPVGPSPISGALLYLEGNPPIKSFTEIKIGKSPYPGITIEMDEQSPERHSIWFQITASGGKIYPESFKIPFSVKINYTDGSFEYIVDEMTITMLSSLVANTPVTPVLTNPNPTVTMTVKPTPVTTTVTATKEPVTTTVTATKEEPTQQISTGGIIGILIGLIAALGLGAGGAFAAFQNGLIR